MHRRAFAAVEHSRLQEALVGGLAHLSAEGVQLADKMTLRGTSDRGVARTVADRVHIDCKDSSVTAEPCGGEGGFDSRVTRADYGYVVTAC